MTSVSPYMYALHSTNVFTNFGHPQGCVWTATDILCCIPGIGYQGQPIGLYIGSTILFRYIGDISRKYIGEREHPEAPAWPPVGERTSLEVPHENQAACTEN